MRYRVHLIGLTKEEPRVTREYEKVEPDGFWLKCWNGGETTHHGVTYSATTPKKDERWYPASGVISVEVINGAAEALPEV